MNSAPIRLIACVLYATLLVASCNGDPTGGEKITGIRAISGTSVTDTIEAYLPPVVFEVRRSDGTLARNAEVRFEHSPPFTGDAGSVRKFSLCDKRSTTCTGTGNIFFATTVVDSTDANGRVTAIMRFARSASTGVLKVSVPALGFIDSATFTITPGNAASVRPKWADTALVIGTSTVVSAQVVDRAGNARTDAVTATASAGSAITYTASTGQASAQQFGTQLVTFTAGAFKDSTIVRVVPGGRIVASVGGNATMFNTDGSAVRVLTTGLGDLTGQPRFDPNRQRVSHVRASPNGFFSTQMSVVDTSGTPRRDIAESFGLNSILVTRLLADGTLLAVAQRTPTAGYSVWRIDADNTLTQIRALPGLSSVVGSADVSPDGTRVAYGVQVAPFSYELRIMNLATGATFVGEQFTENPRFTRQSDRILFNAVGGLAIINSDGTGRRIVVPHQFTNGAIFSPDELYLIGRLTTASTNISTNIVRVSDGVSVPLKIRGTNGNYAVTVAPDWR